MSNQFESSLQVLDQHEANLQQLATEYSGLKINLPTSTRTMNNLWYPNLPKPVRRELVTEDCPCCDGKGTKRDAKTDLIRTCVACKGEGKITYKRKAV